MFASLLTKMQERRDLTSDEAFAAMREIMEGRATPAQVAGLLIGLAMKGERPVEIVGLARAMREQAVTLTRPHEGVFDTCGTGGDRAGTFNVSSIAALVVAGSGVPVAKHGNRAVSSRCGSADLFEALGVDVGATPAVVEHCLESAGIAFFFAPVFHPSMRHAAQTRKELGVRTVFNLLGPLTNPAGARRQIVGVPRPELTEVVARALLLLGSDHAWVVHGADGLDEITTTAHTKVSECLEGVVRTFYVHPSEFGLEKAHSRDLEGGDAEHNAAVARSVLAGAPGPARDVVLLNAGAALFVAGRAESVGGGITEAAAAIDGGAARRTLDAMVEASRGPA